MSDVDPQHLEAWRAEVRAWLATVAEPRTEETFVWGEGDPRLHIFLSMSHDEEKAYLDRVREYRRKRYDAGYGAISLPEEVGGAGLPSVYSVAFADEEREFAVPPSSGIISVTTGLVGAAVSVFGTPEQREKYARAFLRTDMLCAQLFSEPGAGSDLAGLSTKAVRDGAASDYVARVKCLGDWMPEQNLPPLDENQLKSLLPMLCQGCRTLDEVKRQGAAR